MMTSDSSKTRSRFPRAAVKILREWMQTNMNRPYPTSEEKAVLQQCTGLSSAQLSTWLTNARRRNTSLPRSLPRDGIPPRDWSGLSALDRWRHSPPELEAASMTDITRALTDGSLDCTSMSRETFTLRRGDQGTQATSSSGISDTSSCFASSAGSGESQESAHSHQSASLKRRRRRRRQVPASHDQRRDDTRIYQCTFCTDSFKSKHDWTRHEASLHLSLERWICTPFGPRTFIPGKTAPLCAFCDHEDPSDAHIEAHRYSDCCNKPLEARTFHRKDHLRQHLQQLHGVDDRAISMEGWNSKQTKIRSRCGFCEQTFEDWPARNDHLAQHFRAGASIKDWTGCRGLDPCIAMLVQNAMPPYLIGTEINAIVPFSAEAGNGQVSHQDRSPQERGVPTPFEALVSTLSTFVNAQKAQGVIPTDEQLQRQARLIVFGDDDAWDQTAADNLQWLELFKIGHGIDGRNCAEQTQSTDDFMVPQTAIETPSGDSFRLPWYWQSPECLAEYQQCRESFGGAENSNDTSVGCATQGKNC
jgi:hypothetical protein